MGIGTDIVDIRRLDKMDVKVLDKLALRVLTPIEYQYFISIKKTAIPYLAKRWAAKEAASKALGTGIADGISFQHMAIESLTSGQPQLKLTEKALAKATALGAKTWHVSLSDERHYAVAFVVLSI